MKSKFLAALLLCFVGVQFCFAQRESDALFEKYANVDSVTTVYISKAMFEMMPAVENIGLRLANMSGKIESLNILSTEKKELIPRVRKDFSRLIQKDHQELMRVRNGDEQTTFYAIMNGNQVSDLLMIADEGNAEYTVIQVLGRFTLQDVQEMAKDKK